MAAADITVTLGDHTIPVVAQRHARLTNRLSSFVTALVASDSEITGDSILAFLGDQVYAALCAFIPAIEEHGGLPEWEFKGYASQAAMDEQQYDPAMDRSPTVPEIVAAFEAAIKVSRFDVFKSVLGLVDPKLLRAVITNQMAEALDSTPSARSPSLTGGPGPSTSSGMTPRTSTVNAA